MRLKDSLKFAAGLLLAVALLWWVLRGTDPHILWAQLGEASILGLVAAALLGVSQNIFRVLRWRALLAPVREGVPFRPMFDAVILGYATSWVIPGRLGELVRPALLSGRERIALAPCLGSVLADRLLDGMAVLAMFGLGVAFTPMNEALHSHASVIRGGAVGLVALIAVPIVLLMIASRGRDRLQRALAGRKGWYGWMGRMVLSLSLGVDALKRPGLLARILFHTVMTWALIAGSTWVGIRACGVDLPPGGVLIMMPLLVLGIALPTPGGAGGYHAAMRFGLMELFLVAEPLAVGAGILLHLVVVLPIILLGAVLLVIDRIPLHDLLQAARQVREMGEAKPTAPPAARPAEKLS